MNDTESKTENAMIGSELCQDQPDATRSNNLPPAAPVNYSLRVLRAEAESQAISRALKQTGWNRKQAAQLLRISYRGLLYKIRQLNITPDGSNRLPESFLLRASKPK
jgi:DNA-binding NtrC family response regulator